MQRSTAAETQGLGEEFSKHVFRNFENRWFGGLIAWNNSEINIQSEQAESGSWHFKEILRNSSVDQTSLLNNFPLKAGSSLCCGLAKSENRLRIVHTNSN